VKQVQITNCSADKQAVEIWIYDPATNSYSDKGKASSNWSNGSCNSPALSPFTVALPDGHQVTIIGVDPQLTACGGQNDPTVGACQKLLTGLLLGDANGRTLQININ
jgi:hypothetical protein